MIPITRKCQECPIIYLGTTVVCDWCREVKTIRERIAYRKKKHECYKLEARQLIAARKARKKIHRDIKKTKLKARAERGNRQWK